MVEQARIDLASADGLGTNEIARQLRARPARVSKWRTRFARDRPTGLVDAPRPGAQARYRRGIRFPTRLLRGGRARDPERRRGGGAASASLLEWCAPAFVESDNWRSCSCLD
jgi:hypothetical protein